MKVIVAGKHNIAISVVEHIKKEFSQVELFSIFNMNDTGKDSFQRSYRKYSELNNIPEITLSDAYELRDVIFLSLEFDKIIAPEKFQRAMLINIHFSLLPKHQGMYTSIWPILNNDKSSGVTLHKIDRGIDTGDIIEQVEFNLDLNETAKSLYLKYIDFGTKLVIKNVKKIIAGKVISVAQDSLNSSYNDKYSLDYERLAVDYNNTAHEIIRRIYAYTFRDYQLPIYRGTPIFGAKITKNRSTAHAGEMIQECCDSYVIATSDFDCILYKDRLTKMLIACENGNIDLVRELSCNSLLINEKNLEGWSPILVASYSGRLELVLFLLENGADIDDISYQGTTVLMHAKNHLERSGDCSLFDSLIELGANDKVTDNFGLTVKDHVIKSANECSLNCFGSK